MRFPQIGLFAKIVIWFLLTISLVTLVFAGLIHDLSKKTEKDRLAMLKDSFSDQGKLIVSVLKSSDSREREILDNLLVLPVWVFDESGTLLFASKKAKSLQASDTMSQEIEIAAMGTLVLKSPETASFLPLQIGENVGFRIEDESGKPFAAVIRVRKRTMFHFQRVLLEDTSGFWVLTIFSIIGLLCFGLAQNLLKPIFEFQHLSRKVAMGDFQARLPARLTERFDELGALALDFNTMAEKIEKTITGQNQLLWDISHELRTPLTRIGLALELARQAEPEKKGKLISQMETNLVRLNSLIQQILDYSRLNQLQHVPPAQTPVDLSLLAKELITDFQFEIELQKKTINSQFPPNPIVVLGSDELLRRILDNVLRNAVQHTPPQSEIRLSLTSRRENEKDWAIIEIQDAGSGVPAEDVEHIFAPFFQCAKDRNPTTKGIGLGLAIVKRAVEAHKGKVLARNLEQGLCIEIRLPLFRKESVSETL